MNIRTKTQTLAVTLAVLTAPATARANDWAELRGDAAGTRASSEVSGTSFLPAWTYATKNKGKIVAAPVSVDGLVLTADTNGDLAAVGLHDGKERWARVLVGGIGSTPAVGRGRIVVSTFDGQLYALRLQDGAVSWQRPFGGGMNYSSAVLIADATGAFSSVVIPAGFPAQDVFRIDLMTGATQWRTSPGDIAGLLYTSAAVVNGQAIVGMNGGRYQSLDMKSGATRWKFDAAGAVSMSSALVDGDIAYMFPGNANSELFAAQVDTGAPVAGFPVAIPDPAPVVNIGMLGTGPAMSSPMMAGGLVILQIRRQHMLKNGSLPFRVAMREYVVAIDPKLKRVAWQHELANVTASDINGVPELNTCPTPTAFASAGGAAIAVSSSIAGRVAVLDVATGAERWSAPLSAPGLASPTFSNGKLLVGTTEGVLYAFSSQTNTAPTAPTTLNTSGDAADGNLVLGWNAAGDPEGETLSYRVRVAEQGADPTTESETAPGQTTLPVAVKANTIYQVAVRSRDPKGALSAWSESQLITIGALAPTTANVTPTQQPTSPTPPAGDLMPPASSVAAPMAAAPATPTVAVAEVPSVMVPSATNATSNSPAAPEIEMAGVGCAMGGSERRPTAAFLCAFAVALVATARRRARG